MRPGITVPLGAPKFVSPCILHLFLPFTNGDWRPVPLRVVSKDRGAFASRFAYMGLPCQNACIRSCSAGPLIEPIVGSRGDRGGALRPAPPRLTLLSSAPHAKAFYGNFSTLAVQSLQSARRIGTRPAW